MMQPDFDPGTRPRSLAKAEPADRDGARQLETIVRDLWQHGEALVRAELSLGMTLAKDELDHQLERGKRGLRRAALINGLFSAGYLALIAALAVGLEDLLPPWLTLLLAGALSMGGGYALAVSKEPARADLRPARPRAFTHPTTQP